MKIKNAEFKKVTNISIFKIEINQIRHSMTSFIKKTSFKTQKIEQFLIKYFLNLE